MAAQPVPHKTAHMAAPDTVLQTIIPSDAPPASTVVSRPDGYYWLSEDGHLEIGPFETYAEALADSDAVTEEAVAPGETLHEAESDIGIADWLDPDTGEPAEGASPPHISAD
jgi:hypothetical protein